MSESPGKVTSYAPLLGEHNKQVVMEYLGYTEEQYAELKKSGVMAEGV